MSWVLIIALYAGPLAKGDSVSLTTAYFNNKQECINAAEEFTKQFNGTLKDVQYVCANNQLTK
jgi:hypothetical protein